MVVGIHYLALFISLAPAKDEQSSHNVHMLLKSDILLCFLVQYNIFSHSGKLRCQDMIIFHIVNLF